MTVNLNKNYSLVFNSHNNTAVLYNTKNDERFFMNKALYKILKNINLIDNHQLLERNKYIKQLLDKNILTYKNESGVIREVDISTPLVNIQLEITKKCNLRCQHCYLDEYQTQSFDKDSLIKLVDEASKLGVMNFDITGGEPFVHKDIFEIINYISKRGMSTIIFTNGTYCNKQIINVLKNSNVKLLRISLDGHNEDTHDSIRGKGSFNKTLKNIKTFLENGIQIEINNVIHKKNIRYVPELINLFKELNVPFHLDRYVPTTDPQNDNLHISHKEYLDAISEYSNLYTENVIHGTSSNFYCGAGNNYVFIRANGNISLCPTMPEELVAGNIKEKSLEDIWLNSKFFNHFRNLNCKYIKQCEASSICKGGCRSRSIYLEGDLFAEDLQMCHLVKKVTGITPPPLSKEHKNYEYV